MNKLNIPVYRNEIFKDNGEILDMLTENSIEHILIYHKYHIDKLYYRNINNNIFGILTIRNRI
jgi:hypothetical protein